MIVYGATGYTASSCTVFPSNYQCIPAGKTPPTNPNTTPQNIVLLDPPTPPKIDGLPPAVALQQQRGSQSGSVQRC